MRAQARVITCVLTADHFSASRRTLALLIGLGVWQLQRLEWKQGLIAKIEARIKAPPVSLDEAIKRAHAGEDVSYLRVRVEGSFDHAKERYLYALSDGEARLARDHAACDAGLARPCWSIAASSPATRRIRRRGRRVRSPDPSTVTGWRACRRRRARSSPTTSRAPIAGSGAISTP